jgi:hypothetical protein
MMGSPLPEDWDDASDAGGGNEHVPATSIRLSLPRTSASQAAEDAPPPLQQKPDDEILLNAFLQGYGAALEPAGDTRLFMHRMGHALRQLVEYGNRIAAQTRDFALGEGVDWPASAINPLDPRPGMETAERDHRRLLEAMSWLLDETDRLAPATVAARPRAAATLLERLREIAAIPGQDGGRAWRSYGSAYFADGVSPRGRFKAHLAASEDPDAFEELKPDGVSPSDASRSDE